MGKDDEKKAEASSLHLDATDENQPGSEETELQGAMNCVTATMQAVADKREELRVARAELDEATKAFKKAARAATQ